MIEFELTMDQAAVQDLARSLATGVLARDAPRDEQGVDPGVWRSLTDTGLIAPSDTDETWLDPLSQLIVAEELARGDANTAAAVLWGGYAARLAAA